MKSMRLSVSAILVLIGLVGMLSAEPAIFGSATISDGLWLHRVPAKDAARKNPIAADRNAVAAGHALFLRSCASCHGENAQGLDGHPDLHSERVRQATDGELYWLLTNGSLRRGMPSWSRLPEAQRWQLVRYLHTLQTAP